MRTELQKLTVSQLENAYARPARLKAHSTHAQTDRQVENIRQLCYGCIVARSVVGLYIGRGDVTHRGLPRDAMLAWYLLSSCVRLSVRHKSVLYGHESMDRSGFLAWELPLTYPKLCCKVLRVPPK